MTDTTTLTPYILEFKSASHHDKLESFLREGEGKKFINLIDKYYFKPLGNGDLEKAEYYYGLMWRLDDSERTTVLDDSTGETDYVPLPPNRKWTSAIIWAFIKVENGIFLLAEEGTHTQVSMPVLVKGVKKFSNCLFTPRFLSVNIKEYQSHIKSLTSLEFRYKLSGLALLHAEGASDNYQENLEEISKYIDTTHEVEKYKFKKGANLAKLLSAIGKISPPKPDAKKILRVSWEDDYKDFSTVIEEGNQKIKAKLGIGKKQGHREPGFVRMNLPEKLVEWYVSYQRELAKTANAFPLKEDEDEQV